MAEVLELLRRVDPHGSGKLARLAVHAGRSDQQCFASRKPLDQEARGMSNTFTVGDLTIHRIVEMETGFTPALEFLPSVRQIAERR